MALVIRRDIVTGKHTFTYTLMPSLSLAFSFFFFEGGESMDFMRCALELILPLETDLTKRQTAVAVSGVYRKNG